MTVIKTITLKMKVHCPMDDLENDFEELTEVRYRQSYTTRRKTRILVFTSVVPLEHLIATGHIHLSESSSFLKNRKKISSGCRCLGGCYNYSLCEFCSPLIDLP